MDESEKLWFLTKDQDHDSAAFIYRPYKWKEPIARDATIGVKFAQRRVILDDWYLFGGTKWTRLSFRLKHPIVYSKRGILALYRRIKHIFVKPKMIQCFRRERNE
jgi:hypothetical protein